MRGTASPARSEPSDNDIRLFPGSHACQRRSWPGAGGAVVTAAELSSFDSEGTHCVVYAISGEWTGQLMDPAVTLEKATEQNAAATS